MWTCLIRKCTVTQGGVFKGWGKHQSEKLYKSMIRQVNSSEKGYIFIYETGSKWTKIYIIIITNPHFCQIICLHTAAPYGSITNVKFLNFLAWSRKFEWRTPRAYRVNSFCKCPIGHLGSSCVPCLLPFRPHCRSPCQSSFRPPCKLPWMLRSQCYFLTC